MKFLMVTLSLLCVVSLYAMETSVINNKPNKLFLKKIKMNFSEKKLCTKKRRNREMKEIKLTDLGKDGLNNGDREAIGTLLMLKNDYQDESYQQICLQLKREKEITTFEEIKGTLEAIKDGGYKNNNENNNNEYCIECNGCGQLTNVNKVFTHLATECNLKKQKDEAENYIEDNRGKKNKKDDNDDEMEISEENLLKKNDNSNKSKSVNAGKKVVKKTRFKK